MEIQQALGSDIAMVFDECLPYGAEKKKTSLSVDRTARWEKRCKDVHERPTKVCLALYKVDFFEDLASDPSSKSPILDSMDTPSVVCLWGKVTRSCVTS